MKSPASAPSSQHLVFLDGIRGLAAFYVVLFHVIAAGRSELTLENVWLNVLRFGHEAVVVFIVLSGLVLTLPVCRSSNRRLSGGLAGFIERRAWRILPAYYASLFALPLFFLAIEISKALVDGAADWQHLGQTYLNADMLAHVFLVHNLSPRWINSFNPVLWSLATEWWIYFVFAIVLLPVWRRFGAVAAFALCLALSLVPTLQQSIGLRTLSGSPHLLAGFGLGMATAGVLSSELQAVRVRRYRLWLVGAMALAFVAFCTISVALPSIRLRTQTIWITDSLVAVVCAVLILLMGSEIVAAEPRRGVIRALVRVLESHPLVTLGRFSYSLYLTHLVSLTIIGVTLNLAPIRQIVNVSLGPMPVRIFVVLPALLLSAYLFYLLFEKPFLQSRRRKASPMARVASSGSTAA